MISRKIWEAQSLEEETFLENFTANMALLKTLEDNNEQLITSIILKDAEISSLKQIAVVRDAEIVSLKKEIEDLKKVPAPTPTPVPNPTPTPTPVPPSGDLLFSGNMTGLNLSNPLLSWAGLKTFIQSIFFNTQGAPQFTEIKIVKSPVDNVTDMMYLRTIDDDPNVSSTTRAQMTQKFVNNYNPEVYHSSHDMYLHPDIDYLRNYPDDIGFLTIYEIWNDVIAGLGGSSTGSCRWNLQLFKAKGANNPLFWHIEAENKQPGDKITWKQDNKTVPIPYGKVFTLTVYIKRGEGANGRFRITITVDGVSTVLFDVANTTIYSGHPETQIKEWQAFKLYTSDPILDWMRANSEKKFAAYYNNLKWFKN